MSQEQHLRRLAIVSLAVCLGLSAGGACRAGDIPRVEIPFKLEDHFIVVKGALGDVRDLNLVIDTGASSTTINRTLARRLRLSGPKKQVLTYGSRVTVESVTLPVLKIGDLCFEQVPAWVAELSTHGLRIDALIGLDFLKRTNVSIDYEARKVCLGSVVHSKSGLPFYGGLPFVLLPLEIQGKVVRLLLDTGAADLILFARRVEGRIAVSRGLGSKAIHSAAGASTVRSVRFFRATLAGTPLPDLSAFLMDGPPSENGVDGIVGPVSLGLKRLHLDFAQNRVSWDR